MVSRMETPIEQPVDEITRLQRCVNDLVSILALPAMWTGGDPSHIGHTLIDSLASILTLDFVYVRLNDQVGARIEMVRGARLATPQAEDIGADLRHWFGDHPETWPPVVRCRIGDEDLSIAAVPLGFHGKLGIIVTGAQRVDFPEQKERLLLTVAANQASIALREAQVLSEQRGLAQELDRRVAHRTLELAQANEDLRREMAERTRAKTQLAGENELLQMVASGRVLADVLAALCRFVEETADDCICGAYLIDWRVPAFQNGGSPSLPTSFTAPIEGLPVRSELCPCGIAALEKRQVISADLESDPLWHDTAYRSLLLSHGLRSVWSTPILALSGRVLGTFAIYHRRPATPSPGVQELIAQVTHIASIAIERAQDEAALKRSAAFLAQGQHLSSTGTFSWRLDTDDIRFSEEANRIFEFDADSRVSLEQIADRVHPEDIQLLSEKVEFARRTGGDVDYEIRLRLADASVKYLRTIAHGSRDENGRMEYIGAIQDVTARRLSEQAFERARSELAHVARVATLGALTASIAHEVNQPLSGIITNAGTCLRMLDASPPDVDGARETARRTIRDGNRASDMITRLRSLFSKKEFTQELLDLNEATREVIALSLSELQRNRVVVQSELADDLPSITGDRVQLQQVLLNLLRNASDAMVGVDDRPRQLLIRTESEGRDHVRVTVRDAGVGIERQVMDKLFDAFYTTKSSGMGIGLSVSRAIVERHRGRLWAEPNDGPGATFAFSIPRDPERTTDAARIVRHS
ncbi:MAG: histidine kinase [Acidobacteria bacterium]|nr:MAG: histidine kinase [Acidobacteriota bacterium]